MLRDTAAQSFTSQWDSFIIRVFHSAVALTLIHPCRGQSVIGSLQLVVALIGDDIILPCHLDPAKDAFDMTVEWARPDLDPRFVLVRRDGVDLEYKKHPLYDRRTSLFTDELKSGNISLKISKVRQSDEGTYICFVPELKRDTAVQLVVGAASSPVAEINRTSSRVELQCESAGWYPEPELLWLDGDGNLLPAGPTETLRGPDGLYAVSSRVTVEKKHSNITCRVQQKNINQSRETHIHVPGDFFMVISPSSPPSDPTIDANIIGLVIGAAVVLMLLLAVFCVLWKRRRDKSKNKTKDSERVEEGENEPLVTGREEETAVDVRGERTNTRPVPEKIKVKQETREEEEELTRIEAEEELDSRGEQSRKDERETQQVHFVSETEQISDICSPQGKRINPSPVIKKDKNSTERKTREEEAVRGRGVKAEGGEGETKMEAGKGESGLQLSTGTEKPKEQQVSVRGAFNFTDAQKKPQKNQREELKEDQQREEDQKKDDQQREEAQQREEDQRKLQSETRKDQDKDETGLKTQKNKDKQHLMEGNKEDNTEAKKELDQDKNQPTFQPETKPETKKVQTERKKQKDKDKLAPKHQDKTEVKPGGKKGKGQKENQKREKKLVSSEVPERKDLTVQAATPEENKEEEEEMRAQPENLRGAESKKAAQEEVTKTKEGIHTDETCRKNEEKETLQGKEGEPWTEPQLDMNEKPMKEQLEEPVRLSEGGVASQEEPQEPMEFEENPHVDQTSMKEQKCTRQRALHTDQQQAGKRKNYQEPHEQQGRTFKRRKKSEEEDDDDVMETEGEDNNQEDVPAGHQRKRETFQPDQELMLCDQELLCQEDQREQMETQ